MLWLLPVMECMPVRLTEQVNPALALGTFVPHFSKLVLTLTESEDVATEEALDDELLFGLLLLSEVILSSSHYAKMEKCTSSFSHLSLPPSPIFLLWQAHGFGTWKPLLKWARVKLRGWAGFPILKLTSLKSCLPPIETVKSQ